MADEQTAVAERPAPVHESAPAEASSPAAGVAASGTDQAAEKPVTQKDIEALKKTFQQNLSKSDEKAQRLEADNADLQYRLYQRELERQAPDEQIDGVAAATYWKQQAEHAAQQANTVKQTEVYIAKAIKALNQRTGLVIDRFDSRLDLEGGPQGKAKFDASLQRMEDAHNGKKSGEDLIEQRAQELADRKLKELGVDRYDSGDGGGAGGGLTASAYLAMSGDERRALRATAEGRARIDRALGSKR